MTMRAIIQRAVGKLELGEVPRPEPGPGQVRIHTACVGICATDLEMLAGWERTQPPAIPGHEWSGTVEAVGDDVDAIWRGQRVVAENVLSDGGEVGFEHPGAYGEYFLTDARNLHALPAALPFAAGALIEPLAVCVRALRRLRLDTALPTLVFGDGPIALLTLLLLRHAGAPEIALVGGRDGRLAMARELGATPVVDYRTTASAEALLERTGRRLQIIEATGRQSALERALAVAPKGARVLVLGDYGEACASFTWNTLLHQELELIGSNASAGAWPEAVRLAGELHEPLTRLISLQLPAAQFAEAIARMQRGTPDFIKIILHWR